MLLTPRGNSWNTKLPEKVKTKTCRTGRRLSSLFQIKDSIKKELEYDIVYHVNCPEESCEDSYIGESGRRLVQCVKDHNNRDNKFHLLKHSIDKRHSKIKSNKIKMVGQNYNNNKWKRKVSEALLIKEYRSIINVQEQSLPLKLLNQFVSLRRFNCS